ncbi:MAG TPA: hypothetical protein VK563_05825 [Puia sp.]|nr:hypothetical protein [Puia sp.]
MKKIALALFILSASATTMAQSSKEQTFTFGAGINLALPLGDFGKGYSFGLGGQVQGEYLFTENVSGIVSAGYTSFFGKSQTFDFGAGPQTIKNPSVGLIPILAGIRFYPSEQFFIGAQAGLGILSGSGSSTSAFDYYPQIGYNAESFQLVLGYNGLSKNGSTLNHIGLTGIYKFGGR